MKNSADLGGCYPPRHSASVDNTLLYLQNSSYPTQPHSIIAKYLKRILVEIQILGLAGLLNKFLHLLLSFLTQERKFGAPPKAL